MQYIFNVFLKCESIEGCSCNQTLWHILPKKPKKHGSQKFPEIIAVELLLSYVAQVG